MATVISGADLWKTYPLGDNQVHALQGVSCDISQGEFVMLLGPSGSGKSSLLHILGAMDQPSKGRVFCGNQELNRFSAGKRTRFRLEKLGFVFQTFNLLATLTALENVALPMRLAGVGKKERERRAQELLAKVGLAERAEHRPRQLSGGERQRVAIARALANGPELILADEPTGNLDSSAGRTVMEILASLPREGKAVLMVTHNEELTQYADRVLRMRDGRLDVS